MESNPVVEMMLAQCEATIAEYNALHATTSEDSPVVKNVKDAWERSLSDEDRELFNRATVAYLNTIISMSDERVEFSILAEQVAKSLPSVLKDLTASYVTSEMYKNRPTESGNMEDVRGKLIDLKKKAGLYFETLKAVAETHDFPTIKVRKAPRGEGMMLDLPMVPRENEGSPMSATAILRLEIDGVKYEDTPGMALIKSGIILFTWREVMKMVQETDQELTKNWTIEVNGSTVKSWFTTKTV